MLNIANAERNALAKKEKENKYEISGYEINIHDKNNTHALLVTHAIGSKKILDVGCGVGYIGRAIKKLQACTIDGIDVDKTALKIAKKHYDNVFLMKLGDPNDQPFIDFLKNKKQYDCIICGDIIEHLVDPGYIISILSKKLTPNGKILVSIPNIAYIDIVAGLLDGHFNYGEAGILDNTHLRFWTESSFYDFIGNVNEHYHISLEAKRIARITLKHPFINTDILREICGNEIDAFQIIFELKNSKHPTFPRLRKKDSFSDIMSILNEASGLKKQLAQKEKDIQEIKRSTSWKITEPLRKVTSIFHQNKPL